MNIPDFPLPSNPQTVIRFRVPTVADAMEYAEVNPDFEERTTTKYLNSMQVGPAQDSALWTAQDRRTALWWIFISAHPDPNITYSYQCSHCGETHHQDLDLIELDKTATSLSRPPYIDIPWTAGGQLYQWKIVPLDGRAMELLEQRRTTCLQNLDVSSKEYRAEVVRLRLMEDALRLRLPDDPDDYVAAAERRISILMGMDSANEYPGLAAHIRQADDVLRHGLKIVFENGEPLIFGPDHPCKTKQQEVSEDGAGNVPYTNLLIRFRNSAFLPQL